LEQNSQTLILAILGNIFGALSLLFGR